MRPEKLLQCIKCGGNSFSLRYFCILILFVRAWSSFLSLEIFGGSLRLPKYLLDWHSPYPRGITSSDCTLQPFLYVSLHSGAYLIIYFSSDVSIWSLQKLINHMWEETLTDVGLAITTTRSSPWLVLPTLGDEPINREGLAPQSG